MEAGLREVCRSVRIGKILIQRVRSPWYDLDPHTQFLSGRGNHSAQAVLFQGKTFPRPTYCSTRLTPSFPPQVPARHCTTLCSPARPHARYAYFTPCGQRSSPAGTATGGSAIKAVEVLKEQGVPEERIIFINLVGGTR